MCFSGEAPDLCAKSIFDLAVTSTNGTWRGEAASLAGWVCADGIRRKNNGASHLSSVTRVLRVLSRGVFPEAAFASQPEEESRVSPPGSSTQTPGCTSPVANTLRPD